ncbi:MAG: PrsW family intramembrane metalloprotease, partial [Bacteroidales bacterium]|nr:PrsW family intramembrane metalloprotease [Bacteroidales bacterium]
NPFSENIPAIKDIFLNDFYNAFAVAALCEESLKLLALYLLLKWVVKQDFEQRYDGIVYAVCVSLGFAMVENFLYIFNYGSDYSPFVAIQRTFTAVPAHGIFGVAMGYYYGQYRFEKDTDKKKILKRRIFTAPFILHGLYDAFAMLAHSNGLLHEYSIDQYGEDFRGFEHNSLVWSAFWIIFFVVILLVAISRAKKHAKLDAEDIPREKSIYELACEETINKLRAENVQLKERNDELIQQLWAKNEMIEKLENN